MFKICDGCSKENAVASKQCVHCKKEFVKKEIAEEITGGAINRTAQKNIIHKRV